MYIEPNSTVKLLTNVKLNNSYRDTIYFSDTISQYNYFALKAKHNLVNYSFIREKKTLRTDIPIAQLYDCNYMMYQNTSFSNKWFYAFINKINYLGNGTSEIEFEIDIIQTWWNEWDTGECFVEREHVVDDTIGLHTVPENLETGEYITTRKTSLTIDGLYTVFLATEELPEWDLYAPQQIGGFPMPLYWGYRVGTGNDAMLYINNYIKAYAKAGKSDAIVAIFTVPQNFVSLSSSVKEQILPIASAFLSEPAKNNKLYTYPYTCCAVVANGQGVILQYELFDSTQNQSLKIRGGFGTNMIVSATPQNYRGVDNDIENTITLKNFPVIPYVQDYFQNWSAQNHAQNTIGLIGGFATAIGSAMTGNMLGVGAGIGVIANTVSQAVKHSIIPDTMVGNADSSDLNAITGIAGFYTMCRTIKPEYVKLIDNYFSAYGYKVNSVKKPNISARPYWNFIKTIDCVIQGTAPSTVLSTIKEIFDKGITFWRNGDNIGNYNLDNRIV